MKSIINVSSNPDYDGDAYMMRMFKTAWELLTNSELPRREKIDELPEHLQYIYHTLFMEAFLPLRIVFGYFGYKSEFSLRNAFIKLLEEKVKKGEHEGFGIVSFPSLIICGNNSLMKANGMPNAIPFHDEYFYWSIYLSSNKNPLLNLLELIWTRLSFKFGISSTSIFNDDLTYDMAHRFIDCRFDKNEKILGWSYKYFELSDEDLTSTYKDENWQPIELDENELKIIHY